MKIESHLARKHNTGSFRAQPLVGAAVPDGRLCLQSESSERQVDFGANTSTQVEQNRVSLRAQYCLPCLKKKLFDMTSVEEGTLRLEPYENRHSKMTCGCLPTTVSVPLNFH